MSADSSDDIEPTKRVGWGFILVYAIAYAGTWLALLTPILVTLTVRLRQLEPTGVAENISLVLAVGAVFALIGNPLFGRLSDRTTSRFGMRKPWLVGGALGGCVALWLIASADSIAWVLAGWCLAQLAFNAVLAAIVAVLPDQVPMEQRGTVSGVLGVCMPVGQVCGTFLVKSVSESVVLSFMLPAVIGAVGILALAWVLPDRHRSAAQLSPLNVREILSCYWVNPLRHSNFAWAWLSRFLLVTGTAFLNTYQPLYLTDKLGFAHADVPLLIFKATLVQAVMIVIVSVISGPLSDVFRRRKIFVIVGAAMYGLALWVVAGTQSYTVFLLGVAIAGAGHGMFFAVDFALVTEVLPNRLRDAGKDLGILNVANALPQSVAPAFGPMILAASGGSYTWVFIVAGAISLLGSFAIMPLRGVR